MDTLNPEVTKLIDKLRLAEIIYYRAAQRIHNEPMTGQLETLARTKASFQKALAHEFGIDLKQHSLSLAQRIKLELEKAEIEINHLYIRRNEREVLSVCVRREEGLIGMYKDLLNTNRSDDFVQAMLSSQLKDSQQLVDELKETMKSYEFADA